jgi:hypothetical protein
MQIEIATAAVGGLAMTGTGDFQRNHSRHRNILMTCSVTKGEATLFKDRLE